MDKEQLGLDEFVDAKDEDVNGIDLAGLPEDVPSEASDTIRERQEQNRSKVKPSVFAKLFVNHTKKVCSITCVIPVLAIVAIYATGVFEIDNPEGREYFVRDHILTRQFDGRQSANEDFEYSINGTTSDDVQTNVQSDYEGTLAISLLLRGKFKDSGKLASTDIFDGSHNILNPQSFSIQKRAEDIIISNENYTDFCLTQVGLLDCDNKPMKCALPRSFLNHIDLYGRYVNDSEGNLRLCGRKEGHEPVEDSDFQKFLSSMWSGADRLNSRNFFDVNLENNSNSAWAAQSLIPIGVPFAGYNAIDDRESEQLEKYNNFVKDSATDLNEDLSDENNDIYAISEEIANNSFGSIVLRDLSFSVLAILLVFLVIWIHTSSMFLAGTAMLQIVLSFPLTYIIYHFVFRQLYFAALQILTIFLLLGIGADDVFVFTDAWKQAAVVLGPDVDLITRMSWTYRRAVRAMTVTSFTTAAAFFVTALSPIMPISTLGVWAGVLIALQFVLVITMYPCATIIWHRFWRPRLFIRGFKKAAVEDVEKEAATPFWHRLLPVSKRPALKHSTGEYRATERFFRGTWFTFLRRTRYFFIGVGVVLVSLAIWLATSLESPQETENFLPNNFPIRIAITTLQDAFPRSDTDFQLKVRFVWGVKDVDRSGTSQFEVGQLGTAVFDTEFDMKTKEVQQHIFETCKHVQEEHRDLLFSLDTGIEPVRCWIRDYKTWRNGTDFETFATDEELVQDLRKFGEHTTPNGTQPYLNYLTNQHITFNGTSKVLLTEVSFVSDSDAQLPEKVMWPIYLKWQEVIDNLNKDAPQGGNQAFVTSGFPWLFSYTQRTLLRTMISGVSIMIVVALVTLIIATLNWVVALLATVSIGGVIAMLLGLIRTYGWTLGISESVGVVVAVGFSFDGVAHLATAYVESKSKTRLDRTRDALTDLGISVLFGAITTLLAGICLLPAIIIFFTKFAGLILTTIVLSMIWSLMIFPCLLLTVGPQNDFGSLKPILKKLPCFSKNNVENEEVDRADGDNSVVP